MMDQYVELLIFIQDLGPVEFYSTLGISGLITAFCLYAMIRSFRDRRIMQDTPTSRISSASQGFVEISGRARALDGTLTSPGRHKPCVWYRFEVTDQRSNNGHSDHHNSYSDIRVFFRFLKTGRLESSNDTQVEESVYSFYVDDDTGMCTVDPTLGTVRASTVETWQSGHLKYTEYRIREGEQIYCLGDFKTVQGPTRQKAIKETARAKLNQWKQDEHIMKKFDQNEDGNIDMDEWKRAQETAKRMAIKEVGDDYERTEHHELVKPFDKSHPYLITTDSEEEMTQTKLYFTIAYTLGFFIAGAVTTTLVFATTL